MVAISGLEGECPVLFEPMLSTESGAAHFGVLYAKWPEVSDLAAIGKGKADRVVAAIKVIELHNVAWRQASAADTLNLVRIRCP